MKFPPITTIIEYPSAKIEINQNNSPWIDLGLLTDVKIVTTKESIDLRPDNGKLIEIRLHTTIEGKFIHNEKNIKDIKTGLYVVKLTPKETESESVTISNVKFDEKYNSPNIKLVSRQSSRTG